MRSQNVIPSLFLDFMQMQEFAKNPMVFAEGKGIRITDVAGKSYIDGLSGVFVTSLGHGNQAVIAAMTEQLKPPRLRAAAAQHDRAGARADPAPAQGGAARRYGAQVPQRRLGGDRGGDEARPPVPSAERQPAQVQDHQPLRQPITAAPWGRSRPAAGAIASRPTNRSASASSMSIRRTATAAPSTRSIRVAGEPASASSSGRSSPKTRRPSRPLSSSRSRFPRPASWCRRPTICRGYARSATATTSY